MADLTRLPDDLPVPVDDGASDHLIGQALPPITLRAVGGGNQVLSRFATKWLVLYVYPRTGGPGIELPEDWDAIPGARGCTTQNCAFRDHYGDLQSLDATVLGLSAQPIDEQAEFADRMQIPFPLLNDQDLVLSSPPLALPTFEASGTTLYRRLTLIADTDAIAHVSYPVFPPDRDATAVVAWLTQAG